MTKRSHLDRHSAHAYVGRARGARRTSGRLHRAPRALFVFVAIAALLSLASPAQAQHHHNPWVIDPHPPIVNFIPCASEPDYPYGPVCDWPAEVHETRHLVTVLGTITERRYKDWSFLSSSGGEVILKPGTEGFYASLWSSWHCVKKGVGLAALLCLAPHHHR